MVALNGWQRLWVVKNNTIKPGCMTTNSQMFISS
jgi:hypothetical protein